MHCKIQSCGLPVEMFDDEYVAFDRVGKAGGLETFGSVCAC